MSNGSRLRRDRGRAATKPCTSNTPHARTPHQQITDTPVCLVPIYVKVAAPHCSCRLPMVLTACRCCGGMSWSCAKERVPLNRVRVRVVPPDDYSDLASDGTASAVGPQEGKGTRGDTRTEV